MTIPEAVRTSPVTSPFILQYGHIAGWPYLYAESLRRLGIASLNVIPRRADFANLNRDLPHDRALLPAGAGKLQSLWTKARFVTEVARSARLVHYHGGSILHALDARLFGRLGIPTIVTFAGSDARIVSQARANNPYFYRQPDESYDQRVRSFLTRLGAAVRYAAADPELTEYIAPHFERTFLLRQPADLNMISPRPLSCDTGRLRVLHIATDPEVKGSRHVRAALERLKAAGVPFDAVVEEPRYTQQQMRELVGSVDIVVDELCIGAHGVLAVEAMAAGKVVLTYIRDDLVAKYPPDLPIVNVNPDTLFTRLRALLADPVRCAALGRAGRAYVERYHSLEVIGPELLSIYRQIGLSEG